MYVLSVTYVTYVLPTMCSVCQPMVDLTVHGAAFVDAMALPALVDALALWKTESVSC